MKFSSNTTPELYILDTTTPFVRSAVSSCRLDDDNPDPPKEDGGGARTRLPGESSVLSPPNFIIHDSRRRRSSFRCGVHRPPRPVTTINDVYTTYSCNPAPTTRHEHDVLTRSRLSLSTSSSRPLLLLVVFVLAQFLLPVALAQIALYEGTAAHYLSDKFDFRLDGGTCEDYLNTAELTLSPASGWSSPKHLAYHAACLKHLRTARNIPPKRVAVGGVHFPTLITLGHVSPPVSSASQAYCWAGQYTPERCCQSGSSDAECFDDTFTFERCCLGLVSLDLPHVFVGPAKDMNVASAVHHWGAFDLAQSYAMQTFLSEGDIAFDIGANIGGFTVPLAEKVGVSGRVFAFEPFRVLNQMLNANVALNGLSNVFIHQMALGRGASTDDRGLPKAAVVGTQQGGTSPPVVDLDGATSAGERSGSSLPPPEGSSDTNSNLSGGDVFPVLPDDDVDVVLEEHPPEEPRYIQLHQPDLTQLSVPSALRVANQYEPDLALAAENLAYTKDYKEPVLLRSLDGVVAEFRRVGLLPKRAQKRITFLKIDVEFMELDVVGAGYVAQRRGGGSRGSCVGSTGPL